MKKCVSFLKQEKMANVSICCCFANSSITPTISQFNTVNLRGQRFITSAAKSGGFSLKSIGNRCEGCEGKGAIECPGCKGTGKNKKNGNIFERWKCFDCQGFGLKSCPVCGKGGLTPEQRGER
ncbi:protein EMBRYO SAC DEVELOPMENT ARREST 3, chloroplastic [Solanum tuberosum]|nr:PREDICTED: protein EMBRYO SAC DEVELOPMENT ARREST 3, chloroplastic [Solanum tuberosum]